MAIIAAVVVAAAVATALAARGGQTPPVVISPLEPRAVAVARQDFESALSLRGSVARAEALPIKASASGSEVLWKVSDGTAVSAGTTLLSELGGDEGTPLADLREQVAAASAQLKFLQQSSTIDTADADAAVAAADSAVTDAATALADARARLKTAESRPSSEDDDPDERQRAIDEAAADVREAERTQRSAEAELAAARRSRERARLAAEQQLREARTALNALEARVQRAAARAREVKAEAAGVVRISARVAGEDRVVGQLEPAGLVIDAGVDPLTLYRIVDHLGRAVVRIPDGPPEFACASLTLATGSATANGDAATAGGAGRAEVFDPRSGAFLGVAGGPGDGSSTAAGSTVVRCLAPSDVRVFPGLAATVVVSIASETAALVVPVGAVEITAGTSGSVTVVGEGGRHERREVEVGPNDGTLTVIRSGLSEGEQVLDLLPDAESARLEGATADDGP